MGHLFIFERTLFNVMVPKPCCLSNKKSSCSSAPPLPENPIWGLPWHENSKAKSSRQIPGKYIADLMLAREKLPKKKCAGCRTFASIFFLQKKFLLQKNTHTARARLSTPSKQTRKFLSLWAVPDFILIPHWER